MLSNGRSTEQRFKRQITRPAVSKRSTSARPKAGAALSPNVSDVSMALQRADSYLVGGVNSPVRTFRAIGCAPLLLSRAHGAFVIDTQERRFIDLIMGWGALALGHRHPAVVRAARRRLDDGWLLGLTHPAEIELARLIIEAVPSIEQIRFAVSGTEACMTAIRLARASTKRSLIVTCDGSYHGHSDGLLAKSEGIPEGCSNDRIGIPYNDEAALEDTFHRFTDRIAGVIVEPIAANMGVVAPRPGWLQRLRALTQQHRSVLIFDEVVTGFRVRYGVVQDKFGVRPDLTVLGKIIGGGMPIGAVGGSRELMRLLAPEGPVYHAGTFAGHPMAMAAGVATLTALQQSSYDALDALGARLAAGLQEAAVRERVMIQINRIGSMMTVFFTDHPVGRLSDAKRSDPSRFATFASRLLEAGVLVPPSQFEAMFLSMAHTTAIVNRVVGVAGEVFRALSQDGSRK